MSLRGLGDEFKENVRPYQFFALAGLVVLLFTILGIHYYRAKKHEEALQKKAATVGDQKEAQSILTNLIQLKSEAGKMRAELNDRINDMHSGGVVVPRERHYSGSHGLVVMSSPPVAGFSSIKGNDEPVYIPMGAVFRAQMLMPIKTSIQENFVMAQTTHEFRMDSTRRIPRGSRLIGTARLNPVLKGVVVHFHTLVSPRGIEYPVSILALSQDLFPELDGIYFTNQLETYSTILAFNFISGFADASRPREATIYGSVPVDNVKNAVLGGISNSSFRIAEDILEDVRRRAVEYVVVPAGENIFVVFDRRFVLKDGKPVAE